jgi:hypothetical protein
MCGIPGHLSVKCRGANVYKSQAQRIKGKRLRKSYNHRHYAGPSAVRLLVVLGIADFVGYYEKAFHPSKIIK